MGHVCFATHIDSVVSKKAFCYVLLSLRRSFVLFCCLLEGLLFCSVVS